MSSKRLRWTIGLSLGCAIAAGLSACGASSGHGSSGSNAGSSGTLAIPGSGIYAGSGAAGSGTGPIGGSGVGPIGGSGTSQPPAGSAKGKFNSPDCVGCTFPPPNAPACASAPAINIVYPNDTVLVPPNMNVFSVQWTPYGAPFTHFEVDFENAITDTRVVTKCSTPTYDTGQPPMPSGGCELIVDPQTWSFLVAANRGGDPVTVTVRGTTDGTCASSSAASVQMSFASEDVLGAIYYWKSTASANGTGGQIWVKSFGDSVPEGQVTGGGGGGGGGGALGASCNGCHSLSRDGLRMVLYSDDNDSDDEYGDVTGSLIDMTTKTPLGMLFFSGRGSGQPPGFSTLSPDHAYYVSSNGDGNMPTNAFALWSGNTGNNLSTAAFGSAGDRPTQPDWSPDGKSVIYVLPNTVASWRADDDHVFGGSLYTLPYNGNQQFGTPAAFLPSKGENNYYPSYSPDGQFVAFNRVPQDTSVTPLNGCVMTPHPLCPNDSFSNPVARLMLTSSTAGSPVIDLAAANGSPASAPVAASNSWARWSPFLQNYKGNKLLWIAFSSTRDYGVRVRNHKTGMYQCYPSDSAANPGTGHHGVFDPLCQQPQLWMAAINLSASGGADPSRVAFWLPFQDIRTHNHTPQWTQAVAPQMPYQPPPPADGGPPGYYDAGACIPAAGSCLQNPTGCCGSAVCGANGQCQPYIIR
jgi:WD40-like Beta Propeller Repeat